MTLASPRRPLGTTRSARGVRPAIAVVAVAVLAAGCGGERPQLADAPPPTVVATTAPAVEETSTTAAADVAAPAGWDPAAPVLVAEAVGDTVEVFATLDAPDPERVLDRADEISGTLVFVVVGEADDRLEVQLPVRPNGTTGWIDRDAVSLTTHGYRVEVELAAHRLRVLHHGEVVMDTAIGVGTADTPTPGGVFYIKELLAPPDPTGPYGTYAYGLSGFSTVLEEFNGGDGVIGIHGTDEPERLGTDVSHGCIRLHNDDIERLVEQVGLPLGTPVAILA